MPFNMIQNDKDGPNNEQLFSTLLDNHPDGIIRFDAQGRCLYVNQSVLTITECSEQTLLSNKEVTKPLLDIVLTVVATKKNEIMEFIWPNGIISEIRYIPHCDQQGEVFTVLAIVRDITEQKNRVSQLEQRENEFRTLVENSPDGTARVDCDGRHLYINPALEVILGLSATEVIGKTHIELFPDGRFNELDDIIQQVAETGKEAVTYDVIPDSGNGKTYMHLRITPEKDETGSVCALVIIGRDITKQKNIELKLEQSERQFRSLAENAPDNIVRLDCNHRHIYINPQLAITLGVPIESLIGKTHSEIRPDGLFDELEATVAQVIETGVRAEYYLTLPDTVDGERYHHLFITPERDKSGVICGCLMIGRDVTHQKNIALKLEQSEREFRSLAENATDYIARYDLDGRFLYVNPHLEKFFGRRLVDLVGQKPIDVFINGEFDTLYHHIKQTLTSGEKLDYGLSFPSPDGDIYHHLHLIPERNECGDICSCLIIGRDITKIKRAEIQLEHEKVMLKTFFDALPDMIWIKDVNGRYLACNPTFERFIGMSEADIIGKTDADLIPEHDVATFFVEQYNAVIEREQPTAKEKWLNFADDGSRALLHISKTPVIDSTGNIKGVLGIGHDITAIKDIENQLRSVLDNHPDVLIRYDREYRRLYVNPQYEKENGVSAEDVIGKKLDEQLGKITLHIDKYKEKVDRVFNSGESDHFEFQYQHIDGRVVVFDVRIIPEYHPNGAITSVLVVGRNVSDIKQAELMLKTKEREYRTLVENSPDMIVRYDRDCRRVFVNRAYIEQTGTPIELALNATVDNETIWRPIMPHEDYRQRLQRVMDTGESDRILLEWRHDNGLWHSYELLAVPEHDDKGEIVAVLGLGRDVSERKRMENEIVYRENKFRTLTENSPNIIIRYDRDFYCVYANPSYSKTTTLAHLTQLNALADDVPFEPSIIKYKTTLSHVMKTGVPEELVLEFSDSNGTKLSSYIFHVVAEHNPDGQVLGILVIGHDITAIKEIEKRLAQSHDELRGLTAQLVTVREEERKSIAREMHDELGQYLTILRMEIALLRLLSDDKNPAILNQAKELSALVDQVIKVVRDLAVSMRPGPLDMGVISALEWLTEEFNKRTGIPCNLNTDESDIILDDKHATAIFRIVQESLTNVTKYAKASQVDVNFNKNEDEYLLQITDNGIGFDPSISKQKSFGLVGMRERAIMLNGELEIVSKPHCGTTISVKIPSTGRLS